MFLFCAHMRAAVKRHEVVITQKFRVGAAKFDLGALEHLPD